MCQRVGYHITKYDAVKEKAAVKPKEAPGVEPTGSKHVKCCVKG
jgi:hypothetical protein